MLSTDATCQCAMLTPKLHSASDLQLMLINQQRNPYVCTKTNIAGISYNKKCQASEAAVNPHPPIYALKLNHILTKCTEAKMQVNGSTLHTHTTCFASTVAIQSTSINSTLTGLTKLTELSSCLN